MENCEYANNIKYKLGDEENTMTVATAANHDDDNFNKNEVGVSVYHAYEHTYT